MLFSFYCETTNKHERKNKNVEYKENLNEQTRKKEVLSYAKKCFTDDLSIE